VKPFAQIAFALFEYAERPDERFQCLQKRQRLSYVDAKLSATGNDSVLLLQMFRKQAAGDLIAEHSACVLFAHRVGDDSPTRSANADARSESTTAYRTD
jgi:hypothetical protein